MENKNNESRIRADANHAREYRHTGHPAVMETILLGLPSDVALLDDKVDGAEIIKDRLEKYYREIRIPHTTDPVLFLPENYTAAEILQTAALILEGNASVNYTDPGKFLQSHTGILILQVSDVYFYRPEKSWAVDCWVIDTDHLDNVGIDFYIRTNLKGEKNEKNIKSIN